MSIQILYFASLKEALGLASETLDLPASIHTLGDLRDWRVGAGHAALASCKNLRAAVNQEMVPLTHPVADGDEVAFFPPVTGG